MKHGVSKQQDRSRSVSKALTVSNLRSLLVVQVLDGSAYPKAVWVRDLLSELVPFQNEPNLIWRRLGPKRCPFGSRCLGSFGYSAGSPGLLSLLSRRHMDVAINRVDFVQAYLATVGLESFDPWRSRIQRYFLGTRPTC